jgi:phosphatidylserine/phosphatidylglycerophosphate/cardiolipin synthase-like enzyme
MFKATGAMVQILTGPDALDAMRRDIAESGDVFAWMYLIEEGWAREMLARQPHDTPMQIIVDQRSAAIAARIQSEDKRFEAWAWARNRTMHDKTYIFPLPGITYIGTHNMTRGSYTLSRNRSARIESHALSKAMLKQWHEDRARARKINDREGREENRK